MLRIKILVVDKTRSSFLREGEAFYLERIRRYAQIRWIEVRPASMKGNTPKEEVLHTEHEALLRKIASPDYLIALDRRGDQFDSEGLAKWLDTLSVRAGGGEITFVIGGPLGLSSSMLEKAQKVWSLSRLTLTHEMSRLLLLEQLYRALTILKGEKYHK